MNIVQLIDQFELVTDTEEGIEQLRKLILNLAVRGKLTKQDSNDEPAGKFLERINVEKQQLYDRGEIRKPKDYSEIEKSNIPFEVHENWKWVKFGSLGITQTGTTPKTSVSKYYGNYIPFLGPGDLSNGEIDYSNRALSEIGLDEGRLIPQNSILMVCIGGSIGKCNIIDRDVSCNQQINTIQPLCSLNPELVNEFVKADFFQSDILNRASGSATPIINKTKWENLPFPLPPLEEQHRIVQKIETLFAQVDELEQKVQQDRQVEDRLQIAVLSDLQRAETPEASRQSWQCLTQNFEQIYRKPEHIDQLKQAVLNEAVRGRLVPQDPGDEPAEQLLERITLEKQRLYEEGKIRKPKKLEPVSKEEIQFGLPENWKWVRLGDICQLITDGAHHTPTYIEKGIPFISVKNVSSGEINFEGCKYISKEEHEKLSQRCNPERGDILLTKVGTTGIPVIVETDIEFSIFVSVALLKINTNLVHTPFLKYLIQSPLVYSQSIENTRGVGNQNLVLRDINNFTIPFMPYKDQVKLTEGIEQYLTQCDQLKSTLHRAQQTDQRLLQALVTQTTKEKEESEEKQEATIYQLPQKRVKHQKLAKVSGMNLTDVQAGVMARVINGYERYEGKKAHLGRTKMEKTCHIIESHAGIDLGRKPKRMKFGSADYKRLRGKVEPRAKKLSWFSAEEKADGVHYTKGTRFHEPFQELGYKIIDKADEIDRIIELFAPLSTRKAEVRQTVYAAWHDLIAYGKGPSDDEIVLYASTEEYWAKEKEEIPKKEFYEGIKWLRKNNLVPDGKGKLTVKE